MKIPAKKRPLLVALALFWFCLELSGTRSAQEEDVRGYLDIDHSIPASCSEGSAGPIIKKDRLGRAWALWEEWEREQSLIRLAQFSSGHMSSLRTVTRADGFNFSPEFFLDQQNSPWVIWVNWTGGEHRVFVKDMASQKMWLVRAGTRATINTPRLLIGQDGSPRAFWNEIAEGTGKICYRILAGGQWSPLRVLPSRSHFPCLNPDVAIDSRGNLWVVWSRYEGSDYEIFVSRQEGDGWSEEIRVTDNESNDSFPAIALGGDGSPLICWTQSTVLGGRVCVTSIREGRALEELVLAPPQNRTVICRFLQDGDKIGVTWRSGEGMEIVPLSPHLLLPKAARPFSPAASRPIINPSFDEDSYVGFGDSITYGYIDRLPTPELGYPPRLDIILDQNFGPTRVLNEGIGGENTISGLERIGAVIGSDGARYFLIMEGTNDVITANLAMETSAFNLREMARKCLAAGAFPVIATILPHKDWLGVKPYYNGRILELNERIRSIPPECLVPFVDMYEIFNNYPSSDGGLLALLSNDLKHPSEKGYQVMAESWFSEIRNFPFPPVHIRLSGRDPDQVAPNRPPPPRRQRQPKRTTRSAGEPSGTVLAWQANPKIFDSARIKGYRVFRKPRNLPQSLFSLVAFVPGAKRYVDPGVKLIDRFIYAVSAVRTDGVEGPCSGPIDR